MAHQRLTISKLDFGRYLKNVFLPALGEKWQLNSNDTVLRKTEFIIQGLYFDRSSYGKQFVPWFFIQVLPIPRDHFVLNLGSRLIDKRGSDLWLDWAPENEKLVRIILDTYKKQANPAIDHPLTLERVTYYIEKFHRKSEHFYDMWSLGILYGLQNELESARKQLELSVKDLRKRADGWEKKGKAPPEWVEKNTESIFEFLSKLESADRFRTFCEDQAVQTTSALKFC